MREDPRDLDVELTPADDAFLAAVARPLRTPERLAPDFEARLLAGVRASATEPAELRLVAPSRAPSWWRRPRVVQLSPLAALAAAAGFAAVVSTATLLAAARGQPAAPAAASLAVGAVGAGTAGTTVVDTVHVVRFELVEPGARRVALVGDFNGWTPNETLLRPTGAPNSWTISVTLPPGRHEYAFIVEEQDGDVRWARDPFAPPVRDEYGTESSVVTVGESVARRTGAPRRAST